MVKPPSGFFTVIQSTKNRALMVLNKVEHLPPDRLGVNVSVDEDVLHVSNWADRLQPHRLPDAGRRLVEDKSDGHSSNWRRYS